MDYQSQNLTIPRGKVYFAPFLAGTLMPGPFDHFGNCPEFSLTPTTETVDHFSSMRGVRTLDASISLSDDLTGTLTCDDIKPQNVLNFFMGTSQQVAVTSQTGQTYAINDVVKGRTYQIGRTEQNLIGAIRISNVVVRSGATPLVEFVDYVVDGASGMIEILMGSTLSNGANITVTYNTSAHTFTRINSGNKHVEGEMKFVSDNPYGPNRLITLPRVRVTPNGDLSLLADAQSPSWMTIPFSLRTMRKGALPPAIIAEGLPATAIASI